MTKKEKSFCPMLCPNQAINLEELSYPMYASTKLDGIRCVIHPDLGIVSRSLKPIPNVQLNKKFEKLLITAKRNNIVLDGEIFSPQLTFQQITSHVMTQDKEIHESLQFYIFDCISTSPLMPFSERIQEIKNLMFIETNVDIVFVDQFLVKNKNEVDRLFETVLKKGYEGLILKSRSGQYKFGRATLKENICYKVKPYIDKSAIITGVVQATVVRKDAEKKINELGNSVTSKKKDDRILISKASAFKVDWQGKELKVTIAASDIEKKDIWNNRDDYIGKEVNFKAMDVGAKELPRHPVATRWWKQNE